jgi:vacuolar protein sorting-associated protein 54
MVWDIDYLVARLGKIDGFGDTADYLLTIAKSKRPEKTIDEGGSAEKPEDKDSESKDAKTDDTANENSQKTSTDSKSSN